jgi:hypothetical protein
MCGAPVRDNTHITPIVTIVFGILAIFSIFIRCLATVDRLALDDIFAIAALATALPMGIMEFFLSLYGFGKDIWTIPPSKIYRITQVSQIFCLCRNSTHDSQFTWLTITFYVITIVLTKISFLCFCLRIFPSQGTRLGVYVLLAISSAYGLVFTIVTLFNCLPVSYIWTSWDGQHKGKCIDFSIFAWAHAAINIALDIAIIGVPIPELLRLSMSTKKKVYVVAMFSVGALYVSSLISHSP